MKKNVYIILLSIFSCFLGYSQIAEKLYHRDFSKLSFAYNSAYLTGFLSQNNDGTVYPSMDFHNSYSNQFGFYYNFAQKGNFNFKTGLIAKEFNPLFDLNISNEDLGSSSNSNAYLTDFNPVNSFIFSIPIKTEFILPFNEKINLVIGAGLNLNLFTGGGETVTTNIIVTTETESKYVFTSQADPDQITFSGELSVGLNYNFKYVLIQTDFFYSANVLPNPVTGQYAIYNLQNSPDKQGIFNINGDFFGVGLTLTPKKNWLKRKKK